MDNHKKWETKSSSVLFTHDRLTVIEDVVTLPDGKDISYLKFGKSQDSVTIIAQRSDNKILLLSEYSYPPNKWLYEFPGGSSKEDESIEDAAQREFAEESGFRAGRMQHLGNYLVDNRRSAAMMHVFFATNLTQKNLKKDSEEFFEYHWASIAEINNLVVKRKIVNAYVLAPWALFTLNIPSAC